MHVMSVQNPLHDGEKQADKQDSPPKEGTFKAYLALLAGFLGLFISFGWVNCVALFQAEYEADQLKNYSSSDISWIPSIEFFLLLFLSPVSGYLFDNFGPRLPVFIGGLMQVFGLMMTSLSSKYYQIMLSQSIVAGIGPSLLFNPCITAPMTYFRKARALAGGVTVAGSSIGGVVFPLMVNHLLPKIGFAWTMRVCAFLVLGLWMIVVATISSNISHKRKHFNFRKYFRAFKESNFIFLFVFFFFLYWSIIVPMNYLSVAAETRGMSMTMALNLVPIMNASSFLGRTVPNLLADKYGRFNILIIMLILTNVVLLALWLPGKSNAAIIVFASLFGIGSGACIGLAPVLIMNMTPSHDEVGFRMGAALAVGGIAALTSPPIAGAISARSGGTYDNAFIFAAANGFVAAAVLILLRGRVVGWSFSAKEEVKK
ncbi:major facilitator superfamily domain-containing protein [Aspergillus ambiguus]|uniref:major facilitator superfamily domain-containing protein n=1 Tax=Aspergillus ambiguus TaxID=176160 RepID=UPI003CCD0A02